MLNLHLFEAFFTPSPVWTSLRQRKPNLLGAHALEALLLPEEPADYPQRIGVYHALLTHDLLLPLPSGSRQLARRILTLENGDGQCGLPAFTDERAFSLWLEKAGEAFSGADGISGFVSLSFSAVCRAAVETGADWLVLNAAGPIGGEIARCEFLYLADSLLPPPFMEKHPAETL